ncbi:MAG TPA: fasciclin domain-containing protein [Candidatus Saccharimonadales bacterium]
MESHSKVTTFIVAMVIGLVVGGGATYAITGMNDKDKTSSDDSSKQMSMDTTDGVTVGGAKMVKTKDIVDNAVNAKNVTTLVAAVKAAGLVDTLKSEGPFTVFGPTNDAFAKLPEGTVDTLLKPENKDQLVKILTYHVVAGTYTSADLKVMAQKGETLKSVEGETLTPVLMDGSLYIQDAKGGQAKIETSDVISSNGVTHVIDSVLMPKN